MADTLHKTTVQIRKRLADPLPVMEHFYTLQGEGSWAGMPAYFIRLAGCDVGCHWCDVKESWTPSEQQYLPVDEIAKIAANSGAPLAVITGGEPTIYELDKLTHALHEYGMRVHLETAGPHPFSGDFDWVCFSPKKFLAPRQEYYEIASEMKVVIFNESDFEWAEFHAARCTSEVQLFLQPEWSRINRNLDRILAYIRQNPVWRLSLQTHKYLGIP